MHSKCVKNKRYAILFSCKGVNTSNIFIGDHTFPNKSDT